MSPGAEPARLCTRAAHCPVCGRPNHCRLETDESYKGPCWCEQPALSVTALRRLRAELPEPHCLCQNCLEAIAASPEVTWDELVAHSRHQPAASLVPLEGDTYQEGEAIVFTVQYHLRRGYCCGNVCRHCPYN